MMITSVVSMSVTAMVLVPPLFIRFMLIVPMVSVPVIVAIADKFLRCWVPPEITICSSMLIVMQVSLWLVQYHFVRMV